MPLGAVFPLSIEGSYGVDDLRRAQLLFRSIQHFAPEGLFDRFLVVMPDHQISEARSTLDRWRTFGVELVPEEEMLPSFQQFRHVRGWRKQQLIKIAAAAELDTDYYVTFDADIVATKPLFEAELLPGGRALTQYCYLDEHPNWWASSSRVLALSDGFLDSRKVGLHATPAILSRDIGRALMETLAVGEEPGAPHDDPWDVQLLKLHGGFIPTPRGFARMRMRKWTEYSLYYLFALQQGLWNRHHTPPRRLEGEQDTPLFRYFPNEGFSPEVLAEHFDNSDRPPFALLGTKAVLGVEMLERELGRLFARSESSSAE